MNFRPELATAVIDGRKTVTRRLCSDNPRSPWWRVECALRADKTYAVCPGRGKPAIGRVKVLDVRIERLGYLTDAEARLEGFEHAADFEAAFAAINGSYAPNRFVWRVEFEVVSA